MINRHLPPIFGLLTAITLISSTMLIFRLLGFSRGDALYFACLTLAVIAYFSSRRALRKFGRK
jgi:hypothetical protein